MTPLVGMGGVTSRLLLANADSLVEALLVLADETGLKVCLAERVSSIREKAPRSGENRT